ncbi:hypothetical protein ACFO3D_18465 [Virgibacillus kekensis]|uniref:Uncharacterized protein n=1 Tax=Virgibacillus kekensis TaxID=202261 RepID=A0ABV9DQ45_9BACI
MRNLIGDLPDMLILLILYGFLITGVIITVKLLKLLDNKKQNTNGKVIFLIAMLFNSLNFYIIFDLMTVSPQSSSGNGNPHIPYIFISFPLFLSFCIVLSKKIFDILLKKNGLLSLLVITITLTIGYLSIVFQLDFISNIQEKLYYPMNSWLHWWKDIHLNYLYFNSYTFLFGISVSGLTAGILALIKKRSL